MRTPVGNRTLGRSRVMLSWIWGKRRRRVGSGGAWRRVGSGGAWRWVGSGGAWRRVGSGGAWRRVGSGGAWSRVGSGGALWQAALRVVMKLLVPWRARYFLSCFPGFTVFSGVNCIQVASLIRISRAIGQYWRRSLNLVMPALFDA
jgi:hypothetical protein